MSVRNREEIITTALAFYGDERPSGRRWVIGLKVDAIHARYMKSCHRADVPTPVGIFR